MGLDRKEKLKESNRVIWVYRGFPLSALGEEGEQAKRHLFEIIGFEFNVEEEGVGFDSVNAPFPLDNPIKHVDTEVRKLIDNKGVPKAIIVTNLDGGSNFIHVGPENETTTNKNDVLKAYQKIANEYKVPFFHITVDKLFSTSS